MGSQPHDDDAAVVQERVSSNVVVRRGVVARRRRGRGRWQHGGESGGDMEKRKKRTWITVSMEKKAPLVGWDEAVLCDALDDDEASVSASASAAEAMMRREEEDEPNEKLLKRVASKKAMRRMMDKGWSDEEEEEEEGGKGGRKKTLPGSPSTRRPSKLAAIARARGGLRKTATIHSHVGLDLIQMETREKERRIARGSCWDDCTYPPRQKRREKTPPTPTTTPPTTTITKTEKEIYTR